MKHKKSQISIEFIMIFIFMLIITLLFFSVINDMTNNLIRYKEKNYVDDFADMVSNELDLLNNVNKGYYREVPISKTFLDDYQILIYNDTFIIKSKYSNLTYFYPHYYEGEFGIYNKTVNFDGVLINYTYFYFKK